VAPVGSDDQELVLVENKREGFVETHLDAVRFVPLRGGTMRGFVPMVLSLALAACAGSRARR